MAYALCLLEDHASLLCGRLDKTYSPFPPPITQWFCGLSHIQGLSDCLLLLSFSLSLGSLSFPLTVFSHLVTRDPCSGNWLCGHHFCWADRVSRVGNLLGDLPSLPGPPQPPVQLRPLLLWAARPPTHHLRQSPCSLRTAAHHGLPLAHTTTHVSLLLHPLPAAHTGDLIRTGTATALAYLPALRADPTWEGPEELGGRDDDARST